MSPSVRRVDAKSSGQGQKNEQGQQGSGFLKEDVRRELQVKLWILSFLPERPPPPGDSSRGVM